MSRVEREPAGVEDIEVELLLSGLHQHSGIDFRDYARTSLKRRIHNCVREEKVRTISALQERMLHDPACTERVVQALTVSVSAMFRDPAFYAALRKQVLPMLRTYPFIRIWHAGCANGEEVHSLAIMLMEEGLYDRCRIYGTDLSEAALGTAREGAFPLRSMRENSSNYLLAGGRTSLSDFYLALGDRAVFDPALRKNVVFARHNLAAEASFNEFNLILCRNVIIYFNHNLKERVHRLLYSSLAMFGFLGLGSRETLQFSPHEQFYQATSATGRLYRKIR
jgi:chemotaxis protein methyltransferase CheR